MDERERFVADRFREIGWPFDDVREAIGVYAAMNGTSLSYGGDWNEFVEPIRGMGLDLNYEADVRTMIEAFQLFRQAQSLSRTRSQLPADGFTVEYKELNESGFVLFRGSRDINKQRFYAMLDELKKTTDEKTDMKNVHSQIIKQSKIGKQFIDLIKNADPTVVIKILSKEYTSNDAFDQWLNKIFSVFNHERDVPMADGGKFSVHESSQIESLFKNNKATGSLPIFIDAVNRLNQSFPAIFGLDNRQIDICEILYTHLLGTLEPGSEAAQIRQLLDVMRANVKQIISNNDLMKGFLNSVQSEDKKFKEEEKDTILRRLNDAGVSLSVIDAIVGETTRLRVKFDVDFLRNVTNTSMEAANFAKSSFEIVLFFIQHSDRMVTAMFEMQQTIMIRALQLVRQLSAPASIAMANEIGAEMKRVAEIGANFPIVTNLKAINKFLSHSRLLDFEAAIVALSSIFQPRNAKQVASLIDEKDTDPVIKTFQKWYEQVKQNGYILATNGNEYFSGFAGSFEKAVDKMRSRVDDLVRWDKKNSSDEEKLYGDIRVMIDTNLGKIRDKVTSLVGRVAGQGNLPILDFAEVFDDSKTNASIGFVLNIRELDKKVTKYEAFIHQLDNATAPLNKQETISISPIGVATGGGDGYLNAIRKALRRLNDITALEKLALKEQEGRFVDDIVNYCKEVIKYRRDTETKLEKLRVTLFIDQKDQSIDTIVSYINQMAKTNKEWVSVARKLSSFYHEVMIGHKRIIGPEEKDDTYHGIIMSDTTSVDVVIEALKQMFETVKSFDEELTNAIDQIGSLTSRQLVSQLRQAIRPTSTAKDRGQLIDLLKSDFVDRGIVTKDSLDIPPNASFSEWSGQGPFSFWTLIKFASMMAGHCGQSLDALMNSPVMYIPLSSDVWKFLGLNEAAEEVENKDEYGNTFTKNNTMIRPIPVIGKAANKYTLIRDDDKSEAPELVKVIASAPPAPVEVITDSSRLQDVPTEMPTEMPHRKTMRRRDIDMTEVLELAKEQLAGINIKLTVEELNRLRTMANDTMNRFNQKMKTPGSTSFADAIISHFKPASYAAIIQCYDTVKRSIKKEITLKDLMHNPTFYTLFAGFCGTEYLLKMSRSSTTGMAKKQYAMLVDDNNIYFDGLLAEFKL